jgi:serine/threonine protein kinase
VSLDPGRRFGPYEILALLGSGGMGEVYRARHGRLERDVALKVLPSHLADEPEALARFAAEARAVAALSHPNILAIHDFAAEDGTAFAVMELLEGETLRERLARGALPPRKAAECAVQIARGLGAAHEKGIVHRDLKPENLFLTRDGQVKILDFGLARQEPARPASDTDSPTLTRQTQPGTVLGTVGYMAPEQVRGLAATPRSDIFSLGAVLYEMLTGRRAFQRPTGAETMTAILNDEPPGLDESGGVSPALERILRRCLEKRPEDRFRSVHDLAFALEIASGVVSDASLAVGRDAARRKRRWRVVAGIAVALGIGTSLGFFGASRDRSSGEPPSPGFRRLTFRRGTVRSARFSPDGKTIAYGAAWDGLPVKIFLIRSESVWSKTVDVPDAEVFSVSSAGEMAVGLGYRWLGDMGSGTLAQVGLFGGAPRPLLEDVRGADWTPAGSELAVVRRVGTRERIEFPPGRVQYDTDGYLSDIRFSPAGDRIAFLDHPVLEDNRGDVAVLDLAGPEAGRKRTLSRGWARAQGLAWSPGGGEIWFSADRAGGDYAVHAVSLDARERVVLRAPATVILLDVARDGRVLLARETQSWEIVARTAGGERDLSWLDRTRSSDIAADGGAVLATHLGVGSGPNYSVYLRSTDGAPAVRLGEGEARSLSPDGRWAATVVYGPPDRVVLLPTGPGEARTLPNPGLAVRDVHWLPDGRRLLVSGHEPGRIVAAAYVQDVEGGAPRRVSPDGATDDRHWGPVSPDGRLVAATRSSDGRVALHPVEGGVPREVPGEAPGQLPIRWSADGRSLFTVGRGLPVRIHRLDVATGRRELLREIAPADPAGVGGWPQVQITPDGRSYACTYVRRLSDLYLAEGLR